MILVEKASFLEANALSSSATKDETFCT